MAQNGSNKPSFSLSLGAKKVAAPFVKPSPFASIAPKRRTGFESDSDTEEPTTKPQLLSGFDAEKGALSLNPQDDETKGPIVIPRLQNRDWRAESRKKKGLGYIPDQEQRAQADSGGPQVFENGPQAYGLQFVEKKDDVPVATSEDPSRTEAPAPQTEERVSEDQAAIKALLAGDKEKRRSDLVLAPIDTENDWRASRPANEDDAYRMDVESRPDVASLEAYEAIPVEEFGAALLRGMGWKDGEGIGRNKAGGVKEVIRRPAFLGIGAKSKEVAMGEELGAWGKGAKKRNPRLDKTYVPVVKVNKRTGEVIKEDMEVEQKRRREEEPRKSSREATAGGEPSSKGSDSRQDQERTRDPSATTSRRSRDEDEHRSSRREDRDRDRRRRSSRSRSQDRDRDSRRRRERSRDRDSRRDYDRSRDSRRDSSRDRERVRRDRDRDRDSYRSRDRRDRR